MRHLWDSCASSAPPKLLQLAGKLAFYDFVRMRRHLRAQGVKNGRHRRLDHVLAELEVLRDAAEKFRSAERLASVATVNGAVANAFEDLGWQGVENLTSLLEIEAREQNANHRPRRLVSIDSLRKGPPL